MEINHLQDIIVSRDESRNMMGGVEVITIAVYVAQCPNKTACKNHWDYLVRSMNIKKYKVRGAVKKDHSATAKRAQMVVD